jgi:hypothetical protein
MTRSDDAERQTKEKGNSRLLRWVWKGPLLSQLLFDGSEAGSIEFSNRYGSLAVSESAKDKWTFKRSGFLRPKVRVRVAGDSSDYAVTSLNLTGGGTIEMTGGGSYRMGRSGFWRPQLTIKDPTGDRLLTLRINRRSEEATVLVTGSGDITREEYLLASLAWYVLILTIRYEDEAGTMAAIVAAAI